MSPVTGLEEMHFGWEMRLPRYCVSVLATLAMLALSLCVVVCSLNTQGYIDEGSPAHISRLHALSLRSGLFDPASGSMLRAWAPSLLHILAMRLFNSLYSSVAGHLTEFENHRTEHAHAGVLLLKRFCFEAFDAYALLLFLAFGRRDVFALREEVFFYFFFFIYIYIYIYFYSATLVTLLLLLL